MKKISLKTLLEHLKASVTKRAPSSLGSNSSDTQATIKKSRKKFNFSAAQRTPPIWKSKISWRIAITVFSTIAILQAAVLVITALNIEKTRYNELHESTRATIMSALDTQAIDGTVPISEVSAKNIVDNTLIQGIAIYNNNLQRLKAFGEGTILTPTPNASYAQRHKAASGKFFEAIYTPAQLNNLPYFVVVRTNSEFIERGVVRHIMQNIVALLMVSAFVTVVLMLALGVWLIEPLLYLNTGLHRALANPETPPPLSSPFLARKDEIGSVMSMAQRLIKQNAKNIREVKGRAEDQIHKMAYFDTLTGLPNRTNFLEKLTQFTQRTELSPYKQNIRYAVISLDLDHFKDINDSMGHSVGDAILKAVGQRLRSTLPETAVVARSGEDEFSVAMPLVGNMKTARQVGEKVQSVIRSMPITVFNENFQVRSSLGVSTFPDDSQEPSQVLKNADVALNRAKEEGRDNLQEYSKDYERVVQARFQMLRDLRNALDNEELLLHFQPQFDLKTGRIIGAEALLRWFTDDGQFISPAEFIPVAEQSGLIVPIGDWVMRESFRLAKQCLDMGHENIRIAINVSGAQFHQSDIVSYTSKLLTETQLPPHHIELEVTESVFMDDLNHAVDVLKRLHELGVELAIDDFGTGYSSLSYLRQFPIDRLKIDQSFIRDALNDPNDASITKTIIALGRSLNLKVIAEGVETKDHETFLIEQDCDEVQGFRYSRPVPEEEFLKFLNNYTNDLSYFDKATA